MNDNQKKTTLKQNLKWWKAAEMVQQENGAVEIWMEKFRIENSNEIFTLALLKCMYIYSLQACWALGFGWYAQTRPAREEEVPSNCERQTWQQTDRVTWLAVQTTTNANAKDMCETFVQEESEFHRENELRNCWTKTICL